MIIVKLMGGLGNQMFQYAAGKALALQYGTGCKVDVSFLNTDPNGLYTVRKFELDIFEVSVPVIGEKELKQFLARQHSKLKVILNKAFPFAFKSHYITEKGSQYQPNFFSSPKEAYISGFWQSEKYFKKFEKEMRDLFILKMNLIENSDKWYQLIKSCNSVSLHIRRGDYIHLASASSFHGTCSDAYYREALELISEKINAITVFVFSDEIEWCKTNFKVNHPVHFIDVKSAAKEMYLMQHCKHHIIANSSFSWWGAWLNSNKDKIVIAPKKWFKDESMNTSDVIPENWIKI